MRGIEDISIQYYEHDGHVYLFEPITNFIWGSYRTKKEADKHREEFLEVLITEGRQALDLW